MPVVEHSGQKYFVFAEPFVNSQGEPIGYLPFCSGVITDRLGIFGEPEQRANYGFIPGRSFTNDHDALQFAIKFVRMTCDDLAQNRQLRNHDLVVERTSQRVGTVVPAPAGHGVSMGHVYVRFDDQSIAEIARGSLIRIPE